MAAPCVRQLVLGVMVMSLVSGTGSSGPPGPEPKPETIAGKIFWGLKQLWPLRRPKRRPYTPGYAMPSPGPKKSGVLLHKLSTTNPRPHPSGLTTALIVPCTISHFKRHLNNTLLAYAAAPVLPDEVIVSVSGSRTAGAELSSRRKDEFRAQYSAVFRRFVLVEQSRPRTSGANRNLAAWLAADDIDLIVYGDADDLPHPQRVSVIAHFFARMADVLMLHHTLTPNRTDFAPWTPAEVEHARVIPPAETERAFETYCREKYSARLSKRMIDRREPRLLAPRRMTKMPIYQPLEPTTSGGIHTGNLAIRKRVLHKVVWADKHGGVDKTFTWSVVALLGKAAIIEVPLVCYCKSSSHARCGAQCALPPRNELALMQNWPVI